MTRISLFSTVCLVCAVATGCGGGSGGKDLTKAASGSGSSGSVTVKLDTFQLLDQTTTSSGTTLVLQADGEVVGRLLDNPVPIVVRVGDDQVFSGDMAIDLKVANITALQERQITVGPLDLADGTYTITGELDPNRTIKNQIDHDLWSIETFTIDVTGAGGGDANANFTLDEAVDVAGTMADIQYPGDLSILSFFVDPDEAGRTVQSVSVQMGTDINNLEHVDDASYDEDYGDWRTAFLVPEETGEYKVQLLAFLDNGTSATSQTFTLRVIPFDPAPFAGTFNLVYDDSFSDTGSAYFSPGDEFAVTVSSDGVLTGLPVTMSGEPDGTYYANRPEVRDWATVGWHRNHMTIDEWFEIIYDLEGDEAIFDFAAFTTWDDEGIHTTYFDESGSVSLEVGASNG